MIYQYLTGQLNTVPALEGKAYPTTACIDDVEAPFVIYTYKDQTTVSDLSGDVHHYAENILLDFLGLDYDQLHELYRQAESALVVSNYDTGNGEYIFSVNCLSPEPDGFNRETWLLRRTMQVTILWCPV